MWVMAACFAVALAGVGCGDDEPSDAGTAGTGGAAGAGAGGMSGGGGRGGGGGASGGPSQMACVTATVAKIGATGMACATCVCEKNVMLATACANTTECWDLIRCAGQFNCAPGGVTNVACLMANCGTLIDDAASTGAATPFGTPIVRTMCGTECPSAPPPGDGGTDAGI